MACNSSVAFFLGDCRAGTLTSWVYPVLSLWDGLAGPCEMAGARPMAPLVELPRCLDVVVVIVVVVVVGLRRRLTLC